MSAASDRGVAERGAIAGSTSAFTLDLGAVGRARIIVQSIGARVHLTVVCTARAREAVVDAMGRARSTLLATHGVAATVTLAELAGPQR